MLRAPRLNRRIFVIVAIAVAFVLGSLSQLYPMEPTDPARCEAVEVVSYRLGSRGSPWFTVVSAKTGKELEVGGGDAPFGRDYRGPAILGYRRGHWTGNDHLRLYSACPISAG